MFYSISLGLVSVLLLQLQHGISALTMTSNKDVYEFDEPIVVDYDFPNIEYDEHWVGIFPIDSDELLLWSMLCGGSQSWDLDTNGCDTTSTSGSVTFSVGDPSHDYYVNDWALSPGNYEACIMDTVDGEDEFYICVDFEINKFPTNVVEYTAISPFKRKFEYGEPLKARFFVTRKYSNTWIGLYSADETDTDDYYDASHRSESINEPLMWVYTGCNNNTGDQEENNDCANKKGQGTIQIDDAANENSVRYFEEITPGSYRFCLSYLNNKPYTEFKCSAKFEVTE